MEEENAVVFARLVTITLHSTFVGESYHDHGILRFSFSTSVAYSDWRSLSPDAGGKRQSPINIVSREAIFDESLQKAALVFNYGTSRETDILNSGNTLVVIPHVKQGEYFTDTHASV